MSNDVTKSDLLNHSDIATTTAPDNAMTLDSHHSHTDGDAVAQVTQGEDTCNNMQTEQRESTVKAPSSPPGGGLHGEDNVTTHSIGTMSDSTISTGVNTNNMITLMQSSPPPHSYRHSRAYRHFKNPPQPHMCIRTTTEAGEELFINVLSWTRIVIPQEPSDPIPLYGGMRVPPGSPRSPPIVFAVMANPEVLKDSGRHSKDPEERRAMVELMCDFVEAMNPGVKLVRNAVILKDRDISGELKDVWNAVQAQRDREREEQMLQQRQQQHYHNITTQQMFPKSAENNAPTAMTGASMNQQYQYATQQEQYIDNGIARTTTECEMTTNVEMQHVDNGAEGNNVVDEFSCNTETTNVDISVNEALHNESNNHIMAAEDGGTLNNACNFNGNTDTGDQTDAGNKADRNTEVSHDNKPNLSFSASNNNNKNTNATTTTVETQTTTATTTTTSTMSAKSTAANAELDVVAVSTTSAPAVAANTTTAAAAAVISTTNNATTGSHTPAVAVNATPKAAAPPTPITTPPTKKDKLGGFLPNGCIFPRFKNSKNKDKDKEKDKDKDKDKEKDKESKGKDKEKTLLNALKKSKEKKVAPSEQLEKTATATTTTTAATTTTTDVVDPKLQYEKNFINLESEVQRLDLNKIDGTTGTDNGVFIKLKMSTSSATAK